jgi:Holin of 3TMs, for gene-transfer release
MGLIRNIFGALFGGGRNVITETLETFRPNAEAQSQRSHDLDSAAMAQLAAEFRQNGQRGWFDQVMDGINRLPRPMLVFSVFGLLAWTAVDPIEAAKVFTSWAIIPVEFWYVVLAIVTFYFGGRHQAKAQDMQARLVQVAAGVPLVMQTISELDDLHDQSPGVSDTGTDTGLAEEAIQMSGNSAVSAWRKFQLSEN